MHYQSLCFLFCMLMVSCSHHPKEIPKDFKYKEPAQDSKECHPIIFEDTDFNFRYAIPASGWVVINPRKANPRASFAMKHPNGMTFLILAQKKRAKEDKDLTTYVFADAIWKELTRIYKGTGAPVNRDKPVDIDGQLGIFYSVYTEKLEFFNVCALIERGVIYQLIHDGKHQDLEVIKKTFIQLISNFRLIKRIL